MGQYLRESPVKFPSRPGKKEKREGWEVVLEYEDEGNGPFLIDLSHTSKWDIQSADLSQMRPWGLSIPMLPGESTFQNGVLINRMSPTQAAVWHLLADRPIMPPESACTDVTDGYALMALLGKEIFSLMEKVTPLDLSPPDKKPPFLLQGPVLQVQCQIEVLGEKGGYLAVLIACSRGYGQSMAEALLDAGIEWGLHPAGESAFCSWL